MINLASHSTEGGATQPRHIVVMGVSGSGKTTLAQQLAEEMGLPMAEGDEFHPDENIAKMAAGTPLTDEDRWPWLERLCSWMSAPHAKHGSIITCSALRRRYRDVLRAADGDVVFLHVVVEAPELSIRMQHRSGHFMPPGLVGSQLATLEPLETDEHGLTLANGTTIEELAAAAYRWLTPLAATRHP